MTVYAYRVFITPPTTYCVLYIESSKPVYCMMSCKSGQAWPGAWLVPTVVTPLVITSDSDCMHEEYATDENQSGKVSESEVKIYHPT